MEGMEKDAEHGKIPEDSIFYTFYDFIYFMIGNGKGRRTRKDSRRFYILYLYFMILYIL